MSADPRIFSEKSSIEALEGAKSFFQNEITRFKKRLENIPTNRSKQSQQSFIQRMQEALGIAREQFTKASLLLEAKQEIESKPPIEEPPPQPKTEPVMEKTVLPVLSEDSTGPSLQSIALPSIGIIAIAGIGLYLITRKGKK